MFSGSALRWAQWILPFAAIAVLFVGMKTQFLPALPLTIILIGVWLYMLPSARAN